MAEIWEQNEEKSEEEELVVTEHRDSTAPGLSPEDERTEEVAHDEPREALDEQSEDVSSSPARRGHNNTTE